MEFKFRAVDDRPPPPRPPIFNSFSEQPLLGSQHFPPPTNFTLPSPLPNGPSSGFALSDFRPYPGPIRNLNNEVRGLNLLELERDRLREEIILAEIARRRELENEVRREIMLLEREIAIRREFTVTEGLLFSEDRRRRASMRYGSNARIPMVDSFDEQLALSSSCPTAINALPLAQPSDGIALELNNPSVSNKDKVIVLAKPNPNLFGVKRKAETPPTVDAKELPPFGLKKKPKEEWSCALCQVTATSEKGLNQHLQGKKHKGKEAGLITQKGKSPVNVPLKKKTGNPSKRAETCGATNSKLEAEIEAKPVEQNETTNGLNKEKENLKPKLKLLIRKVKVSGELNKTSGSETVQAADGTAEQKMTKKSTKIYRFWCETCQVGSQSSKVIEDHKRGKKHMARLRFCEPIKSDVAELTNTDISSDAIVEKPKDENVETPAKETTNISSDAIVEKPKDENVETPAKEETAYDVSNTDITSDANVENPKDSPIVENQAIEKKTDDVTNTDELNPTPTDELNPTPEA